MSHVWCHGPNCHTYATQDRVRGSKGSKVLRTRKVKQHTTSQWYNPNNFYNYFCSNNCYNEFANAHVQQIIRIAPRTEPLETRIDDPVREKHTHNYSFGEHSYYTTTINKIDTDSNVG
jgi:YHS domain-containing protein